MKWPFTEKDVMLYALSIGCHRDEKRYVYENDKKFSPLPTFPVLALHNGALESMDMADYVENFNPYLELLQPLQTSANLQIKTDIVDITQKGKNTVVVIGVTLIDEDSKKKTSYAEATIFLRGARPSKSGNYLRTERPKEATNLYDIPQREPDACLDEKISPNLAALYRLNGDSNPLHIDDEFAGMGGFSQPILHGLCTYGIAVKHVMKAFCGGDPSGVKSMKARFVKHVFPGETLRTRMWQTSHDTVIFQTLVLERNVIVLGNAAVKLSPQSSKL